MVSCHNRHQLDSCQKSDLSRETDNQTNDAGIVAMIGGKNALVFFYMCECVNRRVYSVG